MLEWVAVIEDQKSSREYKVLCCVVFCREVLRIRIYTFENGCKRCLSKVSERVKW